MEVWDVAVLGAGPAGSALAAACAGRGLRTALVDPAPERVWPQTLGAWADEVDAAGLRQVVAHRWARTEVVLGEDGPRDLGRGYAVLDNAATAGRLRAEVDAAGGGCITGRVSGVVHRGRWADVTLAGGGVVRTRAVVDATGHRGVLVRRTGGHAPAHQAAAGMTVRVDEPIGTPGSMVLMDWRPPGPEADESDPTFLYAMDLGAGRWFVEETSLARRPPMSHGELTARLWARLAHLGVTASEDGDRERVLFGMGAPLPDRRQPISAFGAAAGLVHPATGYQVGRALRRAPRVGGALAESLADPACTPRDAARAAWTAAWPPDLVRQRALHMYGLEVLLGLNGPQLRAFFTAFFDQPRAWWEGYLDEASSAAALAAGMARMLLAVPPGLAARLVAPMAGRQAATLLRGLRG